MTSVQEHILDRIRHQGPGKVFTAKDFLDLGRREAIDHFLGGYHAMRLEAYPSESPDIWGWTHAPFLGATIQGNTIEDSLNSVVLNVEYDSATFGFLWRFNNYCSLEERDGGTYIQCESLSLTRDIPSGLGWLVKPFVTSIPKESLEFTLTAICAALAKSE